jgi:hypothetical protein
MDVQSRAQEFHYRGLWRVVAPYCHGVPRRGVEVLRAVQVGGSSTSRGFGFGKIWSVSEIVAPTLLSAPFAPDDPHYNPDDSAMKSIHCRV